MQPLEHLLGSLRTRTWRRLLPVLEGAEQFASGCCFLLNLTHEFVRFGGIRLGAAELC